MSHAFYGKWRIVEMDSASGRGTAVIKDGKLNGHIFFHQGDDSEFIAVK